MRKRRSLAMNLDAVAEKAGVSTSTVSRGTLHNLEIIQNARDRRRGHARFFSDSVEIHGQRAPFPHQNTPFLILSKIALPASREVQYAGEQRLQDSSKLFEATAENDSDKLRGTEAKEERSG